MGQEQSNAWENVNSLQTISEVAPRDGGSIASERTLAELETVWHSQAIPLNIDETRPVGRSPGLFEECLDREP